jgi:hypothetical protein
MEEISEFFLEVKSGRSTSRCYKSISSWFLGTAAQSAYFSSACTFISISSGRNNEDIHSKEWSADARAPEVHDDQ